MALTTTQLQILKTAILADAVLNAYPNTNDGNADTSALRTNRMPRLAALLCACLLLSTPVFAQNLSTAQLATLKSNIAASGDLVTTGAGSACSGFVGTTVNAVPNSSDGNLCVAAVYNLNAGPTYWVLRTSLSQMELQNRSSQDGTTFDWAAAGGYIARNQGERDAYDMMFRPGNINPSFGSTRSGMDDIFSGTGVGAVVNRTHWRATIRRPITRFEKLYGVASSPAVGEAQPPGANPGARGVTTNPDTLGFDAAGNYLSGPLTASKVDEARNLP